MRAGRIQKVNPPWGSVIYTIEVLESRIGGSTFRLIPGVWAWILLGFASCCQALLVPKYSSAAMFQLVSLGRGRTGFCFVRKFQQAPRSHESLQVLSCFLPMPRSLLHLLNESACQVGVQPASATCSSIKEGAPNFVPWRLQNHSPHQG